jgi:hypothetical protein
VGNGAKESLFLVYLDLEPAGTSLDAFRDTFRSRVPTLDLQGLDAETKPRLDEIDGRGDEGDHNHYDFAPPGAHSRMECVSDRASRSRRGDLSSFFVGDAAHRRTTPERGRGTGRRTPAPARRTSAAARQVTSHQAGMTPAGSSCRDRRRVAALLPVVKRGGGARRALGRRSAPSPVGRPVDGPRRPPEGRGRRHGGDRPLLLPGRAARRRTSVFCTCTRQ